MKSKLIKSEEPKVFKPFKIEIEAETIEDARLLAHVCAHRTIGSRIIKDDKYWRDNYSKEVSQMISLDLYESIDNEIADQGFEL